MDFVPGDLPMVESEFLARTVTIRKWVRHKSVSIEALKKELKFWLEWCE